MIGRLGAGISGITLMACANGVCKREIDQCAVLISNEGRFFGKGNSFLWFCVCHMKSSMFDWIGTWLLFVSVADLIEMKENWARVLISSLLDQLIWPFHDAAVISWVIEDEFRDLFWLLLSLAPLVH